MDPHLHSASVCLRAQLQGNRALDASDRTVVQGKLSRIAHRLKQLVGA